MHLSECTHLTLSPFSLSVFSLCSVFLPSLLPSLFLSQLISPYKRCRSWARASQRISKLCRIIITGLFSPVVPAPVSSHSTFTPRPCAVSFQSPRHSCILERHSNPSLKERHRAVLLFHSFMSLTDVTQCAERYSSTLHKCSGLCLLVFTRWWNKEEEVVWIEQVAVFWRMIIKIHQRFFLRRRKLAFTSFPPVRLAPCFHVNLVPV